MCVCVCACVSMYVCTYVCMYVCMYTYIYIYVYTYIRTPPYLTAENITVDSVALQHKAPCNRTEAPGTFGCKVGAQLLVQEQRARGVEQQLSGVPPSSGGEAWTVLSFGLKAQGFRVLSSWSHNVICRTSKDLLDWTPASRLGTSSQLATPIPDTALKSQHHLATSLRLKRCADLKRYLTDLVYGATYLRSKLI